MTAIIGVVTGGIFGIDYDSLPPFIRQLVFINPLEEPMKMLNIAFLMGIVHILFGLGIRMVSHKLYQATNLSLCMSNLTRIGLKFVLYFMMY